MRPYVAGGCRTLSEARVPVHQQQGHVGTHHQTLLRPRKVDSLTLNGSQDLFFWLHVNVGDPARHLVHDVMMRR